MINHFFLMYITVRVKNVRILLTRVRTARFVKHVKNRARVAFVDLIQPFSGKRKIFNSIQVGHSGAKDRKLIRRITFLFLVKVFKATLWVNLRVWPREAPTAPNGKVMNVRKELFHTTGPKGTYVFRTSHNLSSRFFGLKNILLGVKSEVPKSHSSWSSHFTLQDSNILLYRTRTIEFEYTVYCTTKVNYWHHKNYK